MASWTWGQELMHVLLGRLDIPLPRLLIDRLDRYLMDEYRSSHHSESERLHQPISQAQVLS